MCCNAVTMHYQQGMEVCGNIPELVHSPLCMDSWRKPTSATEELLAVGDIGGCVTVFNIEEHSTEAKRSENRCSRDIHCTSRAGMAVVCTTDPHHSLLLSLEHSATCCVSHATPAGLPDLFMCGSVAMHWSLRPACISCYLTSFTPSDSTSCSMCNPKPNQTHLDGSILCWHICSLIAFVWATGGACTSFGGSSCTQTGSASCSM